MVELAAKFPPLLAEVLKVFDINIFRGQNFSKDSDITDLPNSL